jgi:hypothetical protein
MNDKQITKNNLFNMIPGLKEAMSDALERCGFSHSTQLEETSDDAIARIEEISDSKK